MAIQVKNKQLMENKNQIEEHNHFAQFTEGCVVVPTDDAIVHADTFREEDVYKNIRRLTKKKGCRAKIWRLSPCGRYAILRMPVSDYFVNKYWADLRNFERL